MQQVCSVSNVQYAAMEVAYPCTCTQICRIADVLGMPPLEMILASPPRSRATYFERMEMSSNVEVDIHTRHSPLAATLTPSM
jgi:hypothetical protein